MRISYAQNFEDLMLMRAFKDVENGVYVDIGAQDPVRDSVSRWFYEIGWRGVHVEPVPEYARMLEEARPDERVIRAVVRDSREPLMFYSIADTGLSTGDATVAAEHLKAGFSINPLLIESMTLSDVLESVEAEQIHWLKIDVEGMERVVLESWGGSTVRPIIVVVESTRPLSAEPSHQEWEPGLLARGYEFAHFDGLNRFYVCSDRSDLKSAFALPPNFFDNVSITEHSNFAAQLVAQLREVNDKLQNADQVLAHFKAHVAFVENDRDAVRGGLMADLRLVQTERDHLLAKVANIEAKVTAMEAATTSAEVERRALRAISESLKVEHASAHARLVHALQTAEGLAQRNSQLEQAVVQLRTSLSWTLSSPIRLTGRALRGGLAWILLRPGSRPRRVARQLLNRMRPAPAETGDVASRQPPFYVLVGHTVDCDTNTGVQRVVRGLSKALVGAGRPIRFVKWDERLDACVPIDIEQRQRLSLWNGPEVTASETRLYPPKGAAPTRVSVASGSGGWLIVPEIPHMTFGERPVTGRISAWAHSVGLKSGFVFYDAIPLHRPEFAASAPVHSAYMTELLNADAIWPISRWSADDLVSFWDSKILAPTPTVEPIHLPPEFARPRQTKPEPGENLILSVGTVEPRKNQVALVKAFQRILAERGDGWRLVLVGNLHPLVAPEIDAACRAGSAIEFRGHVSDEELSALYARCSFTVFPSVEEGYGLPILESLWQAKPCICASFGAMGEVAAAGGCLTVDVRDPAALKTALETLMDDDALRDRLTREAVNRAMPAWSDYVAALDAATASNDRYIYYWVDSTVVTPVNTGIQRVVRQLARALLEAGFHLIPVKWGGPGQPMRSVSHEELEHFALWNGPAPDRWSAWRDPRDVAGWFMMGELPLQYTDAEQKMVRAMAETAGLKTAAIFYDTIPWKMRDIYPKPFAEAHRFYIDELHHYDRVLTISHYSQQEMIKVLQEDLEVTGPFGNILASPLPAEFPERSEAPTPVARKNDRSIEVLCVGTVEPRKNHERMLEAFERAAERSKVPLRLVLVGGGHSIEPDLAVRVRRRVDTNPAISWEEKADDARIRELYHRCDFTIYPSVEEGFGMPILESLWYEKPAICASFGAMREVAEGGGCVMVDVTDVEAMAQAIGDLAASPALVAKLTAEAEARGFSTWTDYATDVAHKLDLWVPPDTDSVRARRRSMNQAPAGRREDKTRSKSPN